MNFGNEWPGRRNRVGFTPYNNMHFFNYSTDIKRKILEKNPEIFPPEDLLNHLSMLENPLQKNLADTLHYEKPKITVKEEKIDMDESRPYPSLAGIGNFFSGMFNIITMGTFRRRSPECDDKNNCKPWLNANTENTTCNQYDVRPSQNNTEDNIKEMADCKTAVSQCENKIARVKLMLASKAAPVKTSPRLRRPKKLFVQPDQVTESCVEDQKTEDVVRLANNMTINCVSPVRNTTNSLGQACGGKTKLETAKMKLELPKTKIEVPKTVPENQEVESMEIAKPVQFEVDMRTEIISNCEDKMSKLKALISERRRNNRMVHDSAESESSTDVKTKPIQIVHNKKYKNPNRLVEGRAKTTLRKSIEEDMLFANEVDVQSPENSPLESQLKTKSSPLENQAMTKLSPMSQNSKSSPSLSSTPTDYFNEVTGRFHNNSTTDSEDSFQIVFTDSPQLSPKVRKHSDCESEDSFIMFEDHDCYTSTDVFGESETDYTTDEEDGKISHAFSRTISDLTDESLYQGKDEVDHVHHGDHVDHLCEELDTGLIINDAKKLKRKDQPAKKVRFAEGPPKVHVMRVWAFAARQARIGNWEQHALDRDRFKRRIADVDMAISWVLKPQHRARVKFQRFMPWWHAQRRQEAAEKKKEEDRKKKEEEERIKREEEERIEREKQAKEEEERRKFEEMLSQKKRSNSVGSAEASETGSSDAQKMEEDTQKYKEDIQKMSAVLVNGVVDVEVCVDDSDVITGRIEKEDEIVNALNKSRYIEEMDMVKEIQKDEIVSIGNGEIHKEDCIREIEMITNSSIETDKQEDDNFEECLTNFVDDVPTSNRKVHTNSIECAYTDKLRNYDNISLDVEEICLGISKSKNIVSGVCDPGFHNSKTD